MSDTSKSAGNNDEHAWVSENDPGKLENQLSILGLKFADKRKEPSRYPVWAVILASGLVFISLFSMTYMAPTDSIPGISQETVNQRIQNAIIFGLTGGIIPSISYGVLRNRELQHRNDELAALSVEKRELRSKITTIRQQLTFETMGKQNTAESRMENEIGQLRELVEKSVNSTDEASHEIQEIQGKVDTLTSELNEIKRNLGVGRR